MQTHLALLRGINVSGKKLIKMEDLRNPMEQSGFENVKTYIQSGNVIFDSEETSKVKLAQSIKDLIFDYYGFDVGIVMLDGKMLEKAILENPFVIENNVDLKQLYVAFLSEKPSEDNHERMKLANIDNDIALLSGEVMYLKYDSNAGNSKLSTNLIENKLKVTATSRNWNTTLKLLDLLKERK